MTTPVGATGAGTSIYAGQTASTAKQSLDGETFLNLLVAQLRYQDPSSPMDTTEMMAQTTQLASMEQLTNLANTSLEQFALQMRATATQYVGHHVTYTAADGTTVSGQATAVSFAGSVPTVRVDDVDVTLDAISGIVPAPTTSPSTPDAAEGETPADTATQA